MRAWTFDIELIHSPDALVERMTARDADEAEAMVRARADPCFLLVAQRDGDHYGEDFYVWLAGDRALVRRDEHRDCHAIDPAWAESADEDEMDFSDDGVSSFSAPLADTVSRAQAFQALAHWLRTGEPLPSLTWC